MRHFLEQLDNGEINLGFVKRQLEKQRRLDYMRVKRLDSLSWESSKRNLNLQQPNVKDLPAFCGGNTYGWKFARRLENRQHASQMEGCYGLSQKRAERFVGALPKDKFDDFEEIDDVSPEMQKYAKSYRTFAYFPIDSPADFLEVLSLHGFASCSVHINSDWYDPPNGVIPKPSEQTIWCGTHSFSPTIDFSNKQLRFDNSWGWEWGEAGSGRMDFDYFEKYVTEMHGIAGIVDYFEIQSVDDVCVGWKWSLSEKFSIHAREIVEGKSGDRIAWAFGTRVGAELVIHEFFVWPTFRNRGFGRRLASEVKLLSKEAGLKVRLRVPFVDCIGSSLDGVVAVGRMLGVELQESSSRFYCLDGFTSENPIQKPAINRQAPPPAASPLEWLRRPVELPLKDAISVPVLFGTNREIIALEENVSFGIGRGSELFFGFKVVQVDNIQRFGSAGRSWYESIQEFCFWMHDQFAKNGKDDSKVNLLTNDAFVDLSKFLCESNEKPHHLVYVHGFNTSFEFAMEQAARLKADLKLTGNIFLFSWPSAGRISSYSSDEAAIEAAFPHFLRFMEVIQDAVSEEPLSVLAHSMGNRLLTRFIDQKSITGDGRKFNHAIFAAPDVDHDVFVHSLRSWNLAFSRSTLYANSADVALQLSEIKHKFPRAGLIPPIANVQDLETILVQGFDLFDLAHGYFAQAGNTLHDIFVMLKFDVSADERPGTRPVSMPSNASCWSISHF